MSPTKRSEQTRLAKSIIRWMATGHCGLSSRAMAFCAIDVGEHVDHPLDPADFNRCLLLVVTVPEIRDKFAAIAKLSPEWSGLIRHWDELESLFIGEVGLDWSAGISAPKTYQRMREILESVKGKDS